MKVRSAITTTIITTDIFFVISHFTDVNTYFSATVFDSTKIIKVMLNFESF